MGEIWPGQTSSSLQAADPPMVESCFGECRRERIATRYGKPSTDRERALIERLRATEQDLWRRRSLLLQTERMAKVGGWETDLTSDQMYWSDETYRITELPVAKSISVERAMSFYPPDARRMLIDAIARTMRDHVPFDLQLPYITAKGSKRWVRTMGQTEVVDGRPSRVFGIFQDVTAQKTVETRIWEMANLDALTGVANRAALREKLDTCLNNARQRKGKVGLLVLDLDGFKDVNDIHGHDAGDHVLCMQAERLERAVRRTDFVARLGGDEFAVVLSDLAAESDALETTQRVLDALREPIEWNGNLLESRCSIGLAIFPHHGEQSDHLTKSADLALYRAKEDGKNAYRLYTPSLRKKLEKRTGALELAKEALNKDRILPFYQPVIDVASGGVSGFESLLRWCDDGGCIRAPALIAEAFDDAELGFLLGERMRSKIIGDMRAWRESGVPFGRIGLNLSEPEFLRGALSERVMTSLDKAGLTTRDLVLEVTENALLERSADRAFKELQTLKDAGLHIALDDFGTGASSLVHLQLFPVNAIKIDRSFIEKMLSDSRSEAIVVAILGLGRQLGFDIIAEGVEDLGQLNFLRTHRCPRVQGFLLGRAMPSSDLPSFLADWKMRRKSFFDEARAGGPADIGSASRSGSAA